MRATRAVAVVVLLSCVSWGDAKDLKRVTAKDGGAEAKTALGTPDYLGELARQVLRHRMERHGRDLTTLVQAVVLLDRDMVRTLAAEVSAEPRIVRPIAGGQDDLNAALPERFFVYQDELRERAKALSEAARRRSDADLADSFSKMTATCVACHSAYLSPTK